MLIYLLYYYIFCLLISSSFYCRYLIKVSSVYSEIKADGNIKLLVKEALLKYYNEVLLGSVRLTYSLPWLFLVRQPVRWLYLLFEWLDNNLNSNSF